MIKASIVFLATVSSSLAPASECKNTYMRGGEPSRFDPLAHKALDARYHLVEIDPSSRAYESPKPVAGSMPDTPIDSAGSPIEGYVLIAYVVNQSGLAESPTVVEASDSILSGVALAATKTWRFSPGKVDGRVACIAAMQEFKF